MTAGRDIAIVLGSPTPPGRLYSAIGWLMQEAEADEGTFKPWLIDLRELGPLLVDGRPPEAYGDAVAEAVHGVKEAAGVILVSPIFRASYTGLLKDFLDLLPVDALMSKPVGIVGMGASREHFLALESQLRPMLAWFGCLTLPIAAYLRNDHFADGQLGEEGRGELLGLYSYLTRLMSVLPDDLEATPMPQAARYLKPAKA